MATMTRECRSGRFQDGGWLDFGDTPLLTHDEECELGYRIQDGDLDARDHLVRANLRLVAYIAKKYCNRGVSYADLIAEGNLGLIRAAESFDPEEGTVFYTFAKYWIKQSIILALEIQTRAARVPKHAGGWLLKWRRRESELTNTLERRPTHEEIVESLGISSKELGYIEQAMIASRPSSRVGGPADTDEGDFVPDVVDPREDATLAVDEAMDANPVNLEERLNRLDARERTIIELRFGLNAEAMTLQAVGQVFGCTRGRVRQLEKKALLKMAVGRTCSKGSK